MSDEGRLKQMRRQAEIVDTVLTLNAEYKRIENELSKSSDTPSWALHAAERAFTEADRWHQGIAPFDTEKLAKIIEQEYLRSQAGVILEEPK